MRRLRDSIRRGLRGDQLDERRGHGKRDLADADAALLLRRLDRGEDGLLQGCFVGKLAAFKPGIFANADTVHQDPVRVDGAAAQTDDL